MPPARRFDGPVTAWRGNLWRMIEGQFRASTMRIVDTNDEQAMLEGILENSKPPVPEACQHLDYQFWSPFRYGCYPRASRFRRAGQTPGVWYGAERPLTAVAESIWGALRFYAASQDTPMPRRPVEHTAIEADIQAPLAVDLTTPDWQGQGRWMAPDDYGDCLELADTLRPRGIEAIRYASVRHPDHTANVAVLSCAAFAQPAPISSQTWQIMLGPTLVRAHCETKRQSFMFGVADTRLTWPDQS